MTNAELCARLRGERCPGCDLLCLAAADRIEKLAACVEAAKAARMMNTDEAIAKLDETLVALEDAP